jgi:hypothetical protein
VVVVDEVEVVVVIVVVVVVVVVGGGGTYVKIPIWSQPEFPKALVAPIWIGVGVLGVKLKDIIEVVPSGTAVAKAWVHEESLNKL